MTSGLSHKHGDTVQHHAQTLQKDKIIICMLFFSPAADIYRPSGQYRLKKG